MVVPLVWIVWRRKPGKKLDGTSLGVCARAGKACAANPAAMAPTEAPRKERRANGDELRSNMKFPPSNLLAQICRAAPSAAKIRAWSATEGRRQQTVATSVLDHELTHASQRRVA